MRNRVYSDPSRSVAKWLPGNCRLCRAVDRSGRGLCPDCRNDWLALPHSVNGIRIEGAWHSQRAALTYAEPLRSLHIRFKFHGSAADGHALAELIADRLSGNVPAPGSLLVPVPLHWRRLAGRGFNQAALLAQPLAQRLGLPIRTDLLVRRRATAAQTSRPAAIRRVALRNAFSAREVPDCPVILFDDVVTTGATARAAAVALRDAGAGPIALWTAFHVPRQATETPVPDRSSRDT